jgi:hypothetical protein
VTNRCCPLMTAADRCLGHIGGTADEDEAGSGQAAMVTSSTGGGGRSGGDHLPRWRAAEGSAAAGTPEFYAASGSVLHMPHVWGFLAVVSTLSRCTPGEVADIVNFGTIRVASCLTALETP